MATPSSPAFLKPQDADTPAKPSAAPSSNAPAAKRKGLPRGILFSALGVLLIAAAAGGYLFWRRSKTHASNSSAAAVSMPKAPVATVDLPLDPFVVNLADSGGHSYARIGLTLQLVAPAAAKSEKKEAPAADASLTRDIVRDTIITVLNQEQSADLLAPGGKEHLKQAIEAAVAARDPKIKIADIYFTQFLVQQ